MPTGSIGGTIKSRAGIYRMIILLGSIHALSTYLSQIGTQKAITLSIQDLKSNSVKDNNSFQIFGVLKSGSLSFSRGTLDISFILTDFQDEVEVLYSGQTKFEFKEGETLVLTAYCPNPKDKSKIIAIDFLTKHSMELQNWKDKENQSRENFGIQDVKQNKNQILYQN